MGRSSFYLGVDRGREVWERRDWGRGGNEK